MMRAKYSLQGHQQSPAEELSFVLLFWVQLSPSAQFGVGEPWGGRESCWRGFPVLILGLCSMTIPTGGMGHVELVLHQGQILYPSQHHTLHSTEHKQFFNLFFFPSSSSSKLRVTDTNSCSPAKPVWTGAARKWRQLMGACKRLFISLALFMSFFSPKARWVWECSRTGDSCSV